MVNGRKKRNESFINLPPLDKGNLCNEETLAEFVVKATISTDPILDANNCVVVVIYEGSCKLAFIRLNKDTTWTYVDQSLDRIEDVVHVKEKFYAVKGGGQVFSFDIITQSKQLVAEGMRHNLEKVYLVVLNDKELWMVRRFLALEDEGRVTKKVRIYELDFDKHEWVEKETLGDVALFLGDNFSISVLALNFLGCRPNCIYFNHDHDRYYGYFTGCLHHDFGVYDVKSQSFSQPYAPNIMALKKTYAPNITSLMKTTKKPPYWVVPTFQL
ncbi:putative F-box protein At5g55150 [Prunus avium]|uniref:F-box protein At5g55150 n=1 Tax=Prunus avium TaxID=42229 RepID=A0A6P5TI78_PRUAV|nr:putative F-box protein At5g55150 [Prunus avium]